MLKQIPNLITTLNLLCGCIALLFATSGELSAAAIFVFLGIFFDFFDGLAARLLKAQSEVGVQFDSLADMVTSGLVPAIVMVQLLSKAHTGGFFVVSEILVDFQWNTAIPLLGLLIAIASGYRLAKFNVDTRQTSSFIGLPTPANTLLIMSIPLVLEFQDTNVIIETLTTLWGLIILTLVSSILLNAEIPLFALKFKTWDLKSNLKRYLFLLVSGIFLVLLQFLAIPFIIGLYIVISLVWRDKIVDGW